MARQLALNLLDPPTRFTGGYVVAEFIELCKYISHDHCKRSRYVCTDVYAWHYEVFAVQLTSFHHKLIELSVALSQACSETALAARTYNSYTTQISKLCNAHWRFGAIFSESTCVPGL